MSVKRKFATLKKVQLKLSNVKTKNKLLKRNEEPQQFEEQYKRSSMICN